MESQENLPKEVAGLLPQTPLLIVDGKADLLKKITAVAQVNDEVKADLKAALDEYKSANK